MTNPIVECIANFSEARRGEIVTAIEQAITLVPEVILLDRHSDLDHNRTVLTFVGPPGQIEQAAFQAIQKAAELIDLNQHTGEHPRIGAADVVPFVPISGVSLADCVAIARSLGQRVGAELQIPVYLYEEAATHPDRRALEKIRRGQYEGLKEEILTNPARRPDFGPACLGPAGATVIGARQPLIAFNVYLTTSDLAIAKKIASTIRYSSGGLKYVKALGLLVEGRAQVSMNLTNFRGTPLAQVVEMIRREAARYGVGIRHSELVGLIPQEALVEAARWYLQLDQFEPDQILEGRLEAARLGSMAAATMAAAFESTNNQSIAFLDQLADGTPTPGGGSAAAHSGAAAAALGAMLARLTIGKKKYAAVEQEMAAMLVRFEELRASLSTDVERDAQAFQAVLAALKLPKETAEQLQFRSQAVAAANQAAAQVPFEVAAKAVQVLELLARALEIGNPNAACDAGTGAALARAAVVGAGYNVRTNLAAAQGGDPGRSILDQLSMLERRSVELEARVRQLTSEKAGFSLE